MNKPEKLFNTILSAYDHRQGISTVLEAYRLFNGFYEGCPGLVIDRYGPALTIFNHGTPGEHENVVQTISEWSVENIPGIKSVLIKQRQHPDEKYKNGILLQGHLLPDSIEEFGVTYALDLQLNQDASFYLDTRNLRKWIIDHIQDLSVLNTFAYTGSLGTTAGAAGAKSVTQTDINPNFLQMSKKSWALNGLPDENYTLLIGDFFRVTGRMRLKKQLFDCVILDPPFFSTTGAGRVDMVKETSRLINKVRALVAHEGWLVAINNALFLSGEAFMSELSRLCRSEYLTFISTLPIPPDVTGFPETIVDMPPVDPAPFNHPTKIALLKVFRKDRQK